MGERSSSLFAKLTLRSKRQSTAVVRAPAAPCSSSSSRSTSSPATTPESEWPTSFSGQADYGLGYSSIDHELSPSYKGKRASKCASTLPIEFDRYAESNADRVKRSAHTRSLSRSNILSVIHADEHPLFVSIVDGAAPRSSVQSTVRAGSRLGTSPPQYAAIDVARQQSPFAITRTGSQSHPSRPPARITARRCHSADNSQGIHASHSSTTMASAQAAEHLAGASGASSSSSSSAYYAVARGWKRGIYTTKEDAERQTRNFPGPLIQVFRVRAAAEDFLATSGRFAVQPSSSLDELEEEFVERTRVFKGLDPNSDLARRRTICMSTERMQAQRRSRIHLAAQSPRTRHDWAATSINSPPLSLRNASSDNRPVSPIDKIDAFASLATTSSMQGMTLLPVTHLANSMAFYAKVLDFICISHEPNVQAVMSSSAATVCLRTTEPPSPSSDGADIHTSSNALSLPPPSALGVPSLPSTSIKHSNGANLALPPTPESLNLSWTEPEPLQLPPTSLPLHRSSSAWSSAAVLIEHDGALDAMHSRLIAKLNQWRLEHPSIAQYIQTKGTQQSIECAKLLGGVQQTSWNAQELHLCDLDGHRLIYTTPLCRSSTEKGLF